MPQERSYVLMFRRAGDGGQFVFWPIERHQRDTKDPINPLGPTSRHDILPLGPSLLAVETEPSSFHKNAQF
jgi:hypothetical protein